MALPKKSENPELPNPSFTVDNERTSLVDVPSVTKLLNRKSLEDRYKKEGLKSVTPPPTPPPPMVQSVAPAPSTPEQQPAEVHEIQIVESPPPEMSVESKSDPTDLSGEGTHFELPPPSPPHLEEPQHPESSSIAPVIQLSQRKQRVTSSELIVWTLPQLQSSSDRLGQAIHQLIEKGATQALFLGIVPPSPNSKAPRFEAKAVVQAEDKLHLWTGLTWDPSLIPAIWNYFIKTGQLELSPPGQQTNVISNRNMLRGAFGIAGGEYLTIVRVGPAQKCRGVIALVSNQSILQNILDVMRILDQNASP